MPQLGNAMADNGMTPETTGALALALYAIARSIEAAGARVVRIFKRKAERDAEQKAQDAIVGAIDGVKAVVEEHKERSHHEHTETRETLATIKQQLKDGDRRIGRISDKINKHVEGHQ